jgi:ribosomal protein S18 acetylase RimI-like enzyme
VDLQVKILQADINDAWKILNLQKHAFKSEAELYNDYSISPLTQTIEDIKAEFGSKTFLKAVAGEEIIGSIRFKIKDKTCLIEKLAVHPDFQNQKIGTTLLLEAEKLANGADKIELYTGQKSEKNLHLYKKLGYEVFKFEVINDHLYFVHLRKYMA